MSTRVRVVADDKVPEAVDGAVRASTAAADVDVTAREEYLGPHLRGAGQEVRSWWPLRPGVALRPWGTHIPLWARIALVAPRPNGAKLREVEPGLVLFARAPYDNDPGLLDAEDCTQTWRRPRQAE